FSCVLFFQAEDGIRAFHVTGVQTCALPIWATSTASDPPEVKWTQSRSPGVMAAIRPASSWAGSEAKMLPTANGSFAAWAAIASKIGRASRRARAERHGAAERVSERKRAG